MSSLAERVRARVRPGRRSLTAEALSRPAQVDDHLSRWAAVAILAVMSLQTLFLLVGCDWDLCGDEAEYWAWSQRLDWAYFARGPVIALVVRLGVELFGSFSEAMTGSLMFAARFMAVLIGGLTAWGLFRLAEETTGSRRSAFFAVLILPAIPLFAVGGVIITADSPLIGSWVWSAVWAFRAIRGDDRRAWAISGVIGSLGVLAKYSVLAMPASVGLFLLLIPERRRELLRPGFWTMSLLCVGLGLGPIVAWNAHHGWVGATQLADRVGLASRAVWGGLGPVLGFLGGEFAVLGGFWWVAGVAAIAQNLRDVRHRTIDGATREGTVFLLALWGVTWCACLSASFLGESEANWMATGYTALVVLIGRRADLAFAEGGRRKRAYVISWGIAVGLIAMIHHTEWFYPAIARFVPGPSQRFAAPLRVYDATARMRGYEELAVEVEKRLESLRAAGEDPFVVTAYYQLASTLSFYMKGHPETYCLAWNFGMSREPVNQHDLWHPNPRHDPGPFLGRTVLVVEDANQPPNYAMILRDKKVVRSIEPIERFEIKERGVTVAAWDIAIGRDFRGVAGYEQNRPGARRQPKPPTPTNPPSTPVR